MLAAEGCGRSLEFAEKMSWTTTFSIEKASTESQSVSPVFSDRACSRYGRAIICRMQSGCQNWMSRWRSRLGTVNLGGVQRHAPPCSCFTRQLWAAQPSDPARCKTIEAAATAAVSARRIRGPSETLRHPRSLAAAASSLLIPPSGPISSETVSESAN